MRIQDPDSHLNQMDPRHWGKRGVITGQENKFEERGKGVVNKGKRKREGEVKERVDDIKIKFY